MQLYEPLVRRVPWMGKPVLIAKLWTMYRSKRKAHCEVYSHPAGWELRLTGNHTYPSTRACEIPEDVLSTQEKWKATLERDGWGAQPGRI